MARIKVTVRSLDLAHELIEFYKDRDVTLNINVDIRLNKKSVPLNEIKGTETIFNEKGIEALQNYKKEKQI